MDVPTAKPITLKLLKIDSHVDLMIFFSVWALLSKILDECVNGLDGVKCLALHPRVELRDGEVSHRTREFPVETLSEIYNVPTESHSEDYG